MKGSHSSLYRVKDLPQYYAVISNSWNWKSTLTRSEKYQPTSFVSKKESPQSTVTYVAAGNLKTALAQTLNGFTTPDCRASTLLRCSAVLFSLSFRNLRRGGRSLLFSRKRGV